MSAALHMAESGTIRTYRNVSYPIAIAGIADISQWLPAIVYGYAP
jgi:hypothetical protein